MFELYDVKKLDKNFMKTYKSKESIYFLLDKIANSGIPFEYVDIVENQDVGLNRYNGKYSLDSFLEIYEEANGDEYWFKFKGEDKYIYTNVLTEYVFLFTDNEQDDLNKMVDKKKTKSI